MTLRAVIFLIAIQVSAVTFAASPWTPTVGVNKFDLAKQYLGIASGGDGSGAMRRVTEAMAQKAIADAASIGIRYFRISATGFAPSSAGKRGDLDLWTSDPLAYWAAIDRMMHDLDRANVQGIFTFVWNTKQLPAMVGETTRDLITDPKSRSAQLLTRYITDFITRYKGRQTVLMYELANELNLGADLDLTRRCQDDGPAPQCRIVGNYTTKEMMGFLERLALTVRALDQSRPISSGHSLPRPNATYLRAYPEWSSGRPRSKKDSITDFQSILLEINKPADVISVHLYPEPHRHRFGQKAGSAPDLIALVNDAAKKERKPLFVGEFGDPDQTNAGSKSYAARVLDRIVSLRIAYSALWVWEMYDRHTYKTGTTKATRYSIDPIIHTEIIEALVKTNASLDRRSRPSTQHADDQPPQVVITWPIGCARIGPGATIHVTAFDISGISGVRFFANGAFFGEAKHPPYNATVTTLPDDPSVVTIRAEARDHHGNMAAYKTSLITDQMLSSTVCSTEE